MKTDDLRREFDLLPEIESGDFWSDKRRDIREHVRDDDPGMFLTWPTIVQTMFVGHAPYTLGELVELKADGWGRWENAIREDDFGHPTRLPGEPWTSGNLVHQAYHLMQWEQATGSKVAELETIAEIGGGYGALCKIARRAGFTGRYVIFDLPEFALLQRFYLDAFDLRAEIHVSPAPLECDLLVALWSLSEMNVEIQAEYLSLIRPCHVLASALDGLWHGEDTRGPLRNLAQELKLERRDIPHIRGNYYWLG